MEMLLDNIKGSIHNGVFLSENIKGSIHNGVLLIDDSMSAD